MTVQQPSSAFQSDAKTELLRLRSEFIDEFARLETAVGRRLQKVRIPFEVRKYGFDQMVKKLADAKPSPTLSKANAADLRRLQKDCEPLQRLRASIVHGVMEIAKTTDGETLAIFRNAADVIDPTDECYALTRDRLRQHIDDLATIRRRVEGLTASSPPRPKPAAAAGP